MIIIDYRSFSGDKLCYYQAHPSLFVGEVLIDSDVIILSPLHIQFLALQPEDILLTADLLQIINSLKRFMFQVEGFGILTPFDLF